MNIWSNPQGEALALRIHAEAVKSLREVPVPKVVIPKAPPKERGVSDRQKALVVGMRRYKMTQIARVSGVGLTAIALILQGKCDSRPETLDKIEAGLAKLEGIPGCCPTCGAKARLR